ncbi:MAG: hypothetical protein ACOCQP_02445 [Lentisphaeria bacterium]
MNTQDGQGSESGHNPAAEKSSPWYRRKGLAIGCLIFLIAFLVIVSSGLVIGYYNRHRILPAIIEKLDVDVTEIMKYTGKKSEQGLPPEFMENAYEMNVADGSIKLTNIELPLKEVYEKVIQYFSEEGWEIDEDLEDLPSDVSRQVDTMADMLGKRRRMAVLKKEHEVKFLIVTGDENAAVIAVIEDKKMGKEQQTIGD